MVLKEEPTNLQFSSEYILNQHMTTKENLVGDKPSANKKNILFDMLYL